MKIIGYNPSSKNWAYSLRAPTLAVSILLLITGCSTHRPWMNQPLIEARALSASPSTAYGQEVNPLVIDYAGWENQSIVMAVTLSGGGARAAAFGLGVLKGLDETRFEWDGQQTTLLAQVSLVAGVSGGSILATHLAAFGRETLRRFEPEFLNVNVENSLLIRLLNPDLLYRLSSPWYGRTQILAERLDKLYEGKKFGDLRRRPGYPDLLVTATDLTTGAAFEFTPEQFDLICSDLSSVPLSFAVASSSAVPLLLTPTALTNYTGRCRTTHATALAQALPGVGPTQQIDNYRVRMLKATEQSYRNDLERPYIHLVDGGLTDNLGLRAQLDRLVAGGTLDESFRYAPTGSIRHLVLVAVNSERDLAERIDQTDRVPDTFQVVNSLLFGAGSRETQTTLAMLKDDIQRWQSDLLRLRGQEGSPFAKDAQAHVISISFQDVPDQKLRSQVVHVPTAFTISIDAVENLQAAGRAALLASPDFQDLSRALKSR